MGYTYGGTIHDVDPVGPAMCGTNAGYQKHVKQKTEKCRPCRDAHAAANLAWQRRPKMRTTCGTYPGYMRHKRADEDACQWCLKAYADYMAEYRGRGKPKPPACGDLAGTRTGYARHQRADQEACDPCKSALAAYSRDYRAKIRGGEHTARSGYSDDRCGSYAGYCRHLRHNVPVCGPCAEARRVYKLEWQSNRTRAAVKRAA